MATSWEDLANQALRRLGVRKRIGSAYEGSEVAKACLELFGQTRDELIRSGDWDFARRANVALTLFKGPPPAGGFGPWQQWTPAFPPPPWNYEYLYPADCLQFAAVIPPPVLYPPRAPRPALWRVDDDAFDANGNAATPQKVILAQMPNALAVYRARVTNMALWDAGFTQAFVDALAEGLATALAGNLQLRQAEQQTAVAEGAAAEMRRG